MLLDALKLLGLGTPFIYAGARTVSPSGSSWVCSIGCSIRNHRACSSDAGMTAQMLIAETLRFAIRALIPASNRSCRISLISVSQPGVRSILGQ
jgi:hypothetical protein